MPKPPMSLDGPGAFSDWRARVLRMARHSRSPSESSDYKAHSKRVEQLLRISSHFKGHNVNPDVLDPIAEFLDVRLIPRSSQLSVADGLAIDLSQRCITVLRCCKFRLATDDVLVKKMISLWPSIWEWLQFLLHNFVDADVYGVPIGSAMLQCFGDFVSDLACHPAISNVLMKTPRFFETLAHHWAEDERSYAAGKPEKSGELDDTLAHALGVLTSNKEWHRFSHELLYVVNGPRKLARTLVRRLQKRLDVYGDVSTFEHVRGYLLLLWNLLSFCADDALHHALLISGAMTQTARCLALLCGQATGDRDRLAAASAAMLCVVILTIGLRKTGHRCRWLVQAIQAGLLQAVLASVEFSDCVSEVRTHDGCLELLRRIVGPNLAQMSVVGACAEAVKHFSYKPQLDPRVDEMWTTIVAVVENRNSIKDVIETMVLRMCWNCRRTASSEEVARAEEVALKQCSSCRVMRYCSRECQKLDWLTHKRLCRGSSDEVSHHEERCSQGNKWESSSPLPVKDNIFLHFIAGCELDWNLERINTMLETDYPTTPITDLLFVVDLTSMPPAVDITKVDNEAAQQDKVFTCIRLQARFFWDDEKETLDVTHEPPAGLRGEELMRFWKYYSFDADGEPDLS